MRYRFIRRETSFSPTTSCDFHQQLMNEIKVLFTREMSVFIKVYSKWSYAVVDLRSSECMCARKVLALFQESFNATTIFLQLR